MKTTPGPDLPVWETKHWAEKYVGKPWENGARGPGSFDCWGLLWFVYIREFGIRLPLYPGINANDYMLTGRMISEAAVSGDWEKLDVPENGCAVGMGHRNLTHVGIYLDTDGGMVLHAAETQNVVCEPMSRMKINGWKRLEFYKHHG